MEAALSAARSSAIRSLARSSHSPIRSRLRSGREILDHARLHDLVRGKDHAADDALFLDRSPQPAAGIEEGEVRNRWMVLRQADVVPPGNAVLREHDCGVVAQQRLESGCELH